MRRVVLRMPPEMIEQLDEMGAWMIAARDHFKHFDVLRGERVARAAVARLLLSYAMTSLRGGAGAGEEVQLSDEEAALLKVLAVATVRQGGRQDETPEESFDKEEERP